MNQQLPKEKQNLITAFYTDWNASSLIMIELLRQMQSDFADRFEVVFIDAEQSEQLCRVYGIRKIPALLFFKDDMVVKTLVGTASRAELFKLIDTLYPETA